VNIANTRQPAYALGNRGEAGYGAGWGIGTDLQGQSQAIKDDEGGEENRREEAGAQWGDERVDAKQRKEACIDEDEG
jgi:hypothetical protein